MSKAKKPVFSTEGSWCQCNQDGGPASRVLSCSCGVQENARIDWCWDTSNKSSSVILLDNNTEVKFHPTYSSGTAAVAGAEVLGRSQHHYWEIRMVTPVYGTDVMVGVGTVQANVNSHIHTFTSLLGRCDQTWGYSYQGFIQHAGKQIKYGPKWGQTSIVGIHLDTWTGTLEFYLNRKPLGIAFRGLKNKDVFPMVSSTAAKSGMRLVCAQSFPASLTFSCIKLLADTVTTRASLLSDLPLPPGLQAFILNNYWFLIGHQNKPVPTASDYDTPATTSGTARCLEKSEGLRYQFVHDRQVASINNLRKRKGRVTPQEEESEDEECFLRLNKHNRPPAVTTSTNQEQSCSYEVTEASKELSRDTSDKISTPVNEDRAVRSPKAGKTKKRFTLKKK